MPLSFLEFEQPIVELEAKIEQLGSLTSLTPAPDINIAEELARLRAKSDA
jgi:acetyl-CoA carboxylase carboxyl transferase subunit alpha